MTLEGHIINKECRAPAARAHFSSRPRTKLFLAEGERECADAARAL
jgi:hypothetical protein